jgi:hypothetical protein
MCFTNFVPDVDTREYIGSSMVYTTMFNLGVNFIIIGIQAIGLLLNKARLHYLRYKMIVKWENEKPLRDKKRMEEKLNMIKQKYEAKRKARQEHEQQEAIQR